jgi:hypothetical protein
MIYLGLLYTTEQQGRQPCQFLPFKRRKSIRRNAFILRPKDILLIHLTRNTDIHFPSHKFQNFLPTPHTRLPPPIYRSSNKMRPSLLLIATLASIATAVPNAWPHAKPIPGPQLPKGLGSPKAAAPATGGAECQSTEWEKIHEGHGHNINDGTVAGANLGLKLPGGNGCYKGVKSP